MDNNEKIVQFLENQFARSELRLKLYLGNKSWKYPQRPIVYKTRYIWKQFLAGKRDPRTVIIPGVRGVGKTTAMAQTYFELKEYLGPQLDPRYLLYISLEQLKTLSCTLEELLDTYERVIGSSFEALDHEVFFFFDEIQYDPQWSLTLKILRDKTDKVLVFCSGSAAVALNTDANLARRSRIERLFPTSFAEYAMIHHNVFPVLSLKENLRDAMFNSRTATEVYNKLLPLQKQVDSYFAKLDMRIAANDYLRVGTLPFAAALRNDIEAFDKIAEVLNRVIHEDIPVFKNFKTENISLLNKLLFILTEKCELSLEKLAQETGTSIPQVEKMLEAFVEAEVLIRFKAYGNKARQNTNPSKYLFMSPAFRASYFNIITNPDTYRMKQGVLLEDVIGLYLYRLSKEKPRERMLLFHDANKEGADFIVNNLKIPGNIILEVGRGNKSPRQVKKTMEHVPSLYGATISNSSLSLNSEENIIHIPLRTFLLL